MNMGNTKLRSVIPVGGSIPQPRPLGIKTYETICDNGGRRVKTYYINGVRCNVFGFPITDKAKKKLACKGCDGFRCDKNRNILNSTCRSQKHFSDPKPHDYNQKRPLKTNYHHGPLPAHEKKRYDDRNYIQKFMDLTTTRR